MMETFDEYMDAMEEGRRPVVAQQNGYYAWERFILTMDQWTRICGLLQRQRLPSSLLWRPRMQQSWCRISRDDFCCGMVYRIPGAVSALCQIEYLWQDLDAVQTWLNTEEKLPYTVQRRLDWVKEEVDQRRQWLTGLCRGWLLAVVAS